MMLRMAGIKLKINSAGFIFILLLSCLFTYYIYSGQFFKSENIGNNVSLKELLIIALEIAERGGQEVKYVRESAVLGETSKGKTKEGANDPLTIGDMRSHKAMYYGLKKSFPDIRIISEETLSETVDLNEISWPKKTNAYVNKIINNDAIVPVQDITIWIDPLDATLEYTENLLKYVTTMVCVVVKNEPVIGVIHKPFEDITAWGWVGHGHSENLVPENKEEKNPVRIIVSRSHPGKVYKFSIKAFGKESEIILAGGAGYKVLEVIKGNADAYIHLTQIKKWDICAGNALLNSINGKMTTLKGNEINYSSNSLPINNDGLLATVHGHMMFLTKIKQLMKV